MGEFGMRIVTPGSQARDGHPLYHTAHKLTAVHAGGAIVEAVIRYLYWGYRSTRLFGAPASVTAKPVHIRMLYLFVR